jgi:hypothetical protein
MASVVLFPEIERRHAQICMQILDFHEAPVILIDGLKQHVCDTFFDICFEGIITPHVIHSLLAPSATMRSLFIRCGKEHFGVDTQRSGDGHPTSRY